MLLPGLFLEAASWMAQPQGPLQSLLYSPCSNLLLGQAISPFSGWKLLSLCSKLILNAQARENPGFSF